MKKIYTIIAIALSVVLFASCEKLLDKEPLTSFTNSNYWTSETNVEMYANYFYSEWTGYGNGTGTTAQFYFNLLNDNQVSTGFQDWASKTVDASNSTWSSCYTEIRRANIMIDKIPAISSMNDKAKNNWIGVGRLYRAWQHYCLVRTFGDCYYVDTVLGTEDEDVLYGARTDRDVVMDKVLEDLNYAVANITYDADSRVAYNAAVANAIKAEICLYEGTFCKYRSSADGQKAADETRAKKFLTECKTACEAIINNGMYSLNSSYRANYNSIDLSSNPEMIMYKKYEYGVLCHSVIDYTCSSTMQSGMSKAAFDSYLFTDGLPKATTTVDTNDHGVFTGTGDNIVADISNILATRDPRLSAQVDANLMYNGTPYQRYGEGHLTTSSTGYGVLKFDNKDLGVDYRPEGNKNHTDAPIFWLAVVLLDHAEACAELGDNAAAVASVNKLRARAGMPSLSTSPKADPANNMNVSNLLWEVRRERRVELMYDLNDRYWSLIRWHQLDKLDTSKYPDIQKGAWVGSNHSASSTAEFDSNGYIDRNSKGTRTYEAKYYLRSIPTDQSSLNPQIGQNYGW